MRCFVCGRDGTGDYCQRHAGAKEKLEAAYASWVRAYEAISWTDYLDNVIRNVQTGLWAKEVAQALRGS
jgi:hypothetical protein